VCTPRSDAVGRRAVDPVGVEIAGADLLQLEDRRGTRLVIEPPAEQRVHADDELSLSDSHGSGRVEIRPAAAQIEVLVPAITEQVT
jgi:hypothetical protein